MHLKCECGCLRLSRGSRSSKLRAPKWPHWFPLRPGTARPDAPAGRCRDSSVALRSVARSGSFERDRLRVCCLGGARLLSPSFTAFLTIGVADGSACAHERLRGSHRPHAVSLIARRVPSFSSLLACIAWQSRCLLLFRLSQRAIAPARCFFLDAPPSATAVTSAAAAEALKTR